MKILSITTKKVYDLELSKSGENQMPCPECSEHRKKKHVKCFSYNVVKGAGYCNHCEARFVEYKPFEKIVYVRPKWENFTELSETVAKQFEEKRKIGSFAVNKMRISSKKIFMPQSGQEENVIAFPFFKDGELVNVKYRGANKSFKLESGAELIWYNYDALLKFNEIIITEGEIDTLSFIQEGFENCISVPNGASVGKMDYFDSSVEQLAKIEKFYIAVDNDEKGILLRDELIRRLGAEKCFICSFKEFKDANEYLCGYGYNSLSECLKTAKQPRVEGIYNTDDFLPDIQALFEFGLVKGKEVGFQAIDDLITWETKRFAVWSGTPASGKSELLDFINIRMNLKYGWKVAYWSPENFPLQYHYAKLFEKIYGNKFKKENVSDTDFWQVYEHIKNNFFWVNPENDYTVENIIEKFKYLVKTKGVKVCVLDPFNKIENDVEYSKQGKLLDKMIDFAKKNDVLFHLVAHPKKPVKDKDGTYPLPTMYDISGSGDFFAKCDYGLIVKREQDVETKAFLNEGILSVQKVKYKHLGEQGMARWKYNFENGRYEEQLTAIFNYDKSNWLNGFDFKQKEVNFIQPKIESNLDGFERNVKDIPF